MEENKLKSLKEKIRLLFFKTHISDSFVNRLSVLVHDAIIGALGDQVIA